ncbi:cyclic nucleotide-binding domain-containing protein (plasmid) [Kovacikia minuta CCNUW1]|uniref:cyclic nucleotide-binding domain-containing protein n=1 Tax=Kovacikia minuta TaxID=2931930 RepID=UPI001CCD29C1|nr:cyclic nucleotide-binding domain-containing protein [Kovacikia minuta]UBF30300.1 cyclic nucleotide-binding domain-containing protein [Kovacikia minuta CCNUW1]
MFAQLPERRMHEIRWFLTIGWLLLIASLFYDPWTPALTQPDHPWSPLRLPDECIKVQGQCLEQAPYPLGATIFWGAVVPAGIFILLVFGHELWRRICPLSFLSQIPRALGWQRQFKRENQKTGKVRYELAKVKPDSWLGRNYLYVQLSWFFIGLCGRILFFNADRLMLAIWLLVTIVAAIAVGYFYGGKSWCQYFCPMAPVQTVFSEPGGLLGSKAHTSQQPITQSMCRTVLPDGEEKSACVACQNPCFDIDSERTYWQGLSSPNTSLLRYGYIGIVFGYFVYYYLYAGNWDYYFSGAWNREPDQLASLMKPGLYLFGHVINIPKLVAVPLVLGGAIAIAYVLGQWIEARIQSYNRRHRPGLTSETIRHRIFAICTFGVFNFFFIFAARPLILLTPVWVQYVYDLGLVFLSTLWLQKTWRRSSDLYSRENLANRFRKQLQKLQLDVSQYLDGRSLDDLHTDEVYVLAKILPGFTHTKRHQAYKGVVREALEEGYVNTSSSLSVLQQMRQELGISDDEHREVLEELGIEDPELLNPNRQRTLENQIRLSGYQKSLERLMAIQQRQSDRTGFDQLLQQNSAEIRSLRREYSITAQEEEWILNGLSPNAGNVQKAEYLLARLSDLSACERALNHPLLDEHRTVVMVVQTSIAHKQALIVQSILETLTTLQPEQKAQAIAQSLQQLAAQMVMQLFNRENWSDRLSPELLRSLTQPGEAVVASILVVTPQEVLSHLESLQQDYDPLIQAASLYLIAQFDAARAQVLARDMQHGSPQPLLRETAERILASPTPPALSALPTLEKLVFLSNSDFFQRMQTETLIALGNCAEIKTYSTNDIITEAGDTCRELLLLVVGDANIHYGLADGVHVEKLHPGQTLDELEVLTHSSTENTIIADSETTRILAIPVDAFDEFLDHDPEFARRVLELESRQLQRLVQTVRSSWHES